MTDAALIAEARKHLGEFALGIPGASAASASAALLAASGRVYTGVCVDLSSGIGFCAEHAAMAEMLRERETVVVKAVAVSAFGVIPPCGRCREMLAQVDRRNLACEVLVAEGRWVPLRELLPHWWQDA
jgi:cytidine deaminase